MLPVDGGILELGYEAPPADAVTSQDHDAGLQSDALTFALNYRTCSASAEGPALGDWSVLIDGTCYVFMVAHQWSLRTHCSPTCVCALSVVDFVSPGAPLHHLIQVSAQAVAGAVVVGIVYQTTYILARRRARRAADDDQLVRFEP